MSFLKKQKKKPHGWLIAKAFFNVIKLEERRDEQTTGSLNGRM
jgi:hypothetical protein